MTADLVFYVAAVFVAAGAVKGITGLGLPTVGVSLLGLAMPPATAATLLVLPSLATNVAQCAGRHGRSLLRRFGLLWLFIALGCLFTPVPTVGRSAGFARMALAVLLILYGLWGLLRAKLPHPGAWEKRLSPFIGYAGGVMTVATGVFMIPVSPWLQALRLKKDEMVQALGITFTVCTLGLAVRLGMDRVPLLQFGLPGAVALAAAFAGMAIGARVRRRWDQQTFSRAMFAVFVVIGVLMLAKQA